MSKSAKEEIARLQQELGVSAEVHVTIGDVPATAADTAERLKADLLVIGRGHHAGVLGRLRTHAYAIIRESPCAVVSV
jgi:nucleotide-binding universal stress UspA family protein